VKDAPDWAYFTANTTFAADAHKVGMLYQRESMADPFGSQKYCIIKILINLIPFTHLVSSKNST
jgi:hypothetical protein